jgi:diacylglycerol kinase
MISPSVFLRSVRHALRGLCDVFKAEQSFRIQTLMGILVLTLAFVLPLQNWERILAILLVAFVLILEIINTIIERVADAVQPRLSPMVREVKDMMAGAVFLCSLTSALVGIFIFLPPLIQMACAILHLCKP